MKNKISINRLTLAFASLLLCAVFSSCDSEPKSKRAYIIAKTDDDNWTTSARIDCDSVNMLSTQHAVYWVDGSRFNLYAKSYIKIVSNTYYVSP
jgi:hypothetical protein